MQGPPKTQRSVMARSCLMLGSGGAGSLCALAVVHISNATTAVAAGVGAALAGNAIVSLCAALPGIITALSAGNVARIKAQAEAEVRRERARQRTALVKAGLDGNLEAAIKLLRLQPLDADVLVDPRFSDAQLLALLPDPRAPCEPDSTLAIMRARKPGARPVVRKGTP